MPKSKNEAEVRVKVRRNPNKAIRNAVLAIITIYVVFLVYGFIQNLVTVRMAGVEQVRQGTIRNTLEAEGILVRDEKVVVSPRSGTLEILIPEGERVRVGQAVARVISPSLDSKPGQTEYNITAPRSGIVSYHLDGLEELYSPVNIRRLDLDKVREKEAPPRQYTNGNQVNQGLPVLKIVNNLEPAAVIAIIRDNRVLPEKPKKKVYQLYINNNMEEINTAVLAENKFLGKPSQALFSLEHSGTRFIGPRRVPLTVITESYEGIIVPEKAMVAREGSDGVFTVYKQRVRWKKVEVVGRAQGNVAISGVTPDLKVISNPEHVKEGQPFKLFR